METTNLSMIRRNKMLETINQIKMNITDEETLNNLSMIENELTKKKYGLIWEEHEERVDKELETKIPTFEEVKVKEIKSNGNRFNFLLEGDNLHSLYLLEKTHKEKIDVIYIDPPYNTGNQDFTYGDKILDSVDEFKHSKWLSFMSKRLQIAYKLLSKDGVIFISIDDNEQAPLKMLCDEIFGVDNFIGCLPRRTKSSGKTTNNISSNHDYLLIYAKNVNIVPITGVVHNDEGFKYSDEYESVRGKYKLNQTLDYDSLSYSPSLDYPIELEGNIIYPGGNYEKYLERKNGNYKRADWAWRWSKDLYEFGLKNGFIVLKKGKDGKPRIYTKTYLNAKIVKNNSGYEVQIEERKKPISSLEFVDNIYSNDNAKKDLLKVFSDAVFDYPKPLELIKMLLRIYDKSSFTILDFFAGSGTTGQAVLEFNKEEQKNINFILCTNNDNNICEEITYKRLKSLNIDEFNLKYYKTDYVPKINTDEDNLHLNLMKNIRNLIQLENGIEIDDKKIQVYLEEKSFDNFTSNKELLDICEKVYISSDILITSEQEMILENNNIKVYVIPEYYFEDEIMEVA